MKKHRTTIIIIASIVVLAIALSIGTAYASVTLAELPISLPFRESELEVLEMQSSTAQIIDHWENAIYYERTGHQTVEEVLDNVEVEEITDKEMFSSLTYVDHETLETYIAAHPESIENGYEKLFIDKVDLLNTPTGIKTIYGDDILAIDVFNGITIVGIDVNYEGGTSKVKLAIVNNQAQLDMSLVRDLSYWDIVKDHAAQSSAILALNASSYNWNDSGTYATLYGAAKLHGTLYRKAASNTDLLGISETGLMTIGGTVDDHYSAFEFGTLLRQNGANIYVVPVDGQGQAQTEPRYAQSALGQNTSDGATFLMVCSGGTYGSGIGVTNSDILAIAERYKIDTAVTLSGGSRSIMWWNGRTVNETVGYSDAGVRLPNAIVILPNTAPAAPATPAEGKEPTTPATPANGKVKEPAPEATTQPQSTNPPQETPGN